MFRWLNGPGAAFRNPLPGSTNYLNAYDSSGQLLRSKGKNNAGEDKVNDATMNLSSGHPIPLEEPADMIPFPSNSAFRSQTVLSDAIKEEIYNLVAIQKLSVRRVSADLGVDMHRVGAVVRLKTVEKEWQEKVPSSFIISKQMMRIKKISISLEDLTYG